MELRLDSPAGGDPAVFQWPLVAPVSPVIFLHPNTPLKAFQFWEGGKGGGDPKVGSHPHVRNPEEYHG